MIKLTRLALSNYATKFLLEKRTKKVADKPTLQEKADEVDRLWKLKDNKTFKEVKEKLRDMCPGIERCMYCEDSAGTDIEHFYPKDTYPSKAFEWDNYLLACSTCNSNYKRDQFPLGPEDQPLLINPVEEEPGDHISLSPKTGKYTELTAKGAKSIDIYGLNRDPLVKGRYYAWASVQAHIILYGSYKIEGNGEEAEQIKQAVCNFPHASVFAALLDILESPMANRLIWQDCIQTITRHPEIKTWMD